MPRVAAALATDTTFITAASPATALTAVTAAATAACERSHSRFDDASGGRSGRNRATVHSHHVDSEKTTAIKCNLQGQGNRKGREGGGDFTKEGKGDGDSRAKGGRRGSEGGCAGSKSNQGYRRRPRCEGCKEAKDE